MLLRNGGFAKSLLTQGTRASRHNTAHSISDIVRVTASRRERLKSGQHDSTVSQTAVLGLVTGAQPRMHCRHASIVPHHPSKECRSDQNTYFAGTGSPAGSGDSKQGNQAQQEQRLGSSHC